MPPEESLMKFDILGVLTASGTKGLTVLFKITIIPNSDHNVLVNIVLITLLCAQHAWPNSLIPERCGGNLSKCNLRTQMSRIKFIGTWEIQHGVDGLTCHGPTLFVGPHSFFSMSSKVWDEMFIHT